MSDKRDDGGPAWGRQYGEVVLEDGHQVGIGPQDGMTLRDWFAGQALAGVLNWSEAFYNPSHAVEWAYGLADAMLAERKKP